MASSASTVNGLSNEGSSGSVDNTPSVVPRTQPPFNYARILAMSEIDQSEYDWPSCFDEEPGETVESEALPGPGYKLIPLARRGVRAMRVAKNERGSPEPCMEEWLFDQPRKCSHCSAVKTPRWRYGPEGHNTLCNACGLTYKSGRLVPEYRPANSPTADPEKHSNLHNKVMELRKRKRAAEVDPAAGNDGGSPVV